MLLLDAIVAIIAIGCITGIASMMIDRFGGRHRALEEELRLARAQIALLERQNAQLEQQVEWHTRLLRTVENRSGAGAEEPGAHPDQLSIGQPEERRSRGA